MKAKVGLWIDHKKAVIATVTDEGEGIGTIISKVEKQPRRLGDSPLKGRHEALNISADDSRQRAFMGHLNTYYDTVIDGIRNADSILLFGPGEAKDELRKRLEHKQLGGLIKREETADKMTNSQLLAKIRQHA